MLTFETFGRFSTSIFTDCLFFFRIRTPASICAHVRQDWCKGFLFLPKEIFMDAYIWCTTSYESLIVGESTISPSSDPYTFQKKVFHHILN